jgi:hypothetical protein
VFEPEEAERLQAEVKARTGMPEAAPDRVLLAAK